MILNVVGTLKILWLDYYHALSSRLIENTHCGMKPWRRLFCQEKLYKSLMKTIKHLMHEVTL